MTSELIAFSDALAHELVPMPADADDVCPMCRSWRPTPTALCGSCITTSGQVTHPCPMIIPISYYATPSPLRERMHNFKEHPDPHIQATDGKAVAAIAARYILQHRDALTERYGPWDATIAVPSTHRPGPPRLQTVIQDNFPGAVGPFATPLQQGAGDMDFNQASNTGFTSNQNLTGQRVLLIDDTFTTGARIQSAHHALITAGATVPIAVVVTRKINPSAEHGNLDMWNRQRQIEFKFGDAPWWLN